MKRVILLSMVLFCAAFPSSAEDPPPAPPQKDGPELVAAGWCPVDPDDDGPRCDAGVGVSLASRGRVSWVAVAGTKTIGTGVALSASRRVAVAVGVVLPYDDRGIRSEGASLALGATVSFWRRR